MRPAILFHSYYSNRGSGESFFVASAGDGVGTQADPFGPSEFEAALGDGTITSGSTVKFNKGDTFDIGEVDIAVASLTIDAYGTGDDPVFRGSEDISGLTWTDEGGGIYSAPMVTEPNWIWINGECAKLAETARIPILSRGSTTTITIDDANVAAYTSIVGSYCVVKDRNFSISYRRAVTDYNDATGVITIDGEVQITLNIDLALYNKQEFLSGNNEWAWESGTLYVRASASPSTLNIRSSAFDYAFKTTATATFKNLEIQEYFQFGIWSVSAVVDVNNCTIHDIRDTSVLVEKAVTGVNISDNTISRMGNNGITVRPCTDSTFNRNTITDSGMQRNYGWQTWAAGDTVIPNVSATGIAYVRDKNPADDDVDGSNCQFNNNTITRSAYCRINVSIGTNNFIQENTISNFTSRFKDGGGIYIYHFAGYQVGQQETEISNNIISNSNGDFFIKTGIYSDNYTRATYAHDNVIFDCMFGMYLNRGTQDHTVEDNILHNNTSGIAYGQTDDTVVGLLYLENINNQLNRNTFSCTISTQRCLDFIIGGSWPNWNPFSGTGGADNNIYINPYGENVANSDNKGNNLTLAELQTAYGEDANSTSQTNFIVAPGNPAGNLYLVTNTTDNTIQGTAPEGGYDEDLTGYYYNGPALHFRIALSKISKGIELEKLYTIFYPSSIISDASPLEGQERKVFESSYPDKKKPSVLNFEWERVL